MMFNNIYNIYIEYEFASLTAILFKLIWEA